MQLICTQSLLIDTGQIAHPGLVAYHRILHTTIIIKKISVFLQETSLTTAMQRQKTIN